MGTFSRTIGSKDKTGIKSGKNYAGTKLDIIFEGTDIGAPLMTKEQFEKMSGMKLIFTGVPNQVQMQKLLVSFATGSAAFDVTVVLVPNLPVFIRFLEPLDDLIKKWGYDFDDFLRHFQSLMTDTPLVPGGKVYGLPNDYDQHYWHSRKKFLDEIGASGPPKTWEEVVEYSKKLKSILPDGMFSDRLYDEPRSVCLGELLGSCRAAMEPIISNREPGSRTWPALRQSMPPIFSAK